MRALIAVARAPLVTQSCTFTRRHATTQVRPLEGTLVLSLEQAMAAPFCTSRLAEAGARVIKIERDDGKGDFARGYDDFE